MLDETFKLEVKLMNISIICINISLLHLVVYCVFGDNILGKALLVVFRCV